MELFSGKLALSTVEWEKSPKISLREAAKLSNLQNEFQSGRCNCKAGCKDQRCACRKKGAKCSSRCHSGSECSNQPPASKNAKRKFPSDRSSPAKKPTQTSDWIPELLLSETDKTILQGQQWLTDRHVSAAQMILLKQFPAIDGLQSPLLGQTSTWAKMKLNGVQILNENQNHWICVSTVDCPQGTINIYNSLYKTISKDTTKQVCALLHRETDAISLHAMDSQIQDGASDCGLFAIATATALCHGIPPSNVVWDQSVMRSHLCECFQYLITISITILTDLTF